jgi:hypothetical protein
LKDLRGGRRADARTDGENAVGLSAVIAAPDLGGKTLAKRWRNTNST